MKHIDVLKDRLEESGNDPVLAKEILSYLYPCMLCKNYCINVKNYYVKDCECSGDILGKCVHNFQCGNKSWIIIYMCYDCMRDTMLNHQHGKNGVLTFIEHQDYIRLYNEADELLKAYQLGIMY